mmetsp:Transcript_90058/g.285156  ORF Transcript_90058/g.285156 Transcript_90058/m.285156 type:complete len:355 (-) Transcript_90058:67-1131(-)
MRVAAALLLLLVALPCAGAFAPALPVRPRRAALAAAAAAPRLGRGSVLGRLRSSPVIPVVRPPRPLHAKAAETDAEADGEPPFEAGFSRAALGTGILAATEVAGALRHWGRPSAGYSLGVVPVLLLTMASLRVLQSAASRGRLSGGTFRMMSLASLAAFAAMLFVTCFDVLKMFALLAVGRFSWAAILPLCIGILAINTALPAIGASYGTLAAEGLPKFKTAVRAEKGNRGLLTLLAIGYVVTAVHQVMWGGAMLMYSNWKVVGALRCFIVAACAHVCQTAAVAGPKRLSSETYRTLNLALMLDSAICCGTVVFLGAPTSFGAARAVAVVGALPLVSLLSSAGGWAVGKLYRPA